MKQNITFKMWHKSLDTLREIHKLTGERMTEILDRALNRELQRVQRRTEKQVEKGGTE